MKPQITPTLLLASALLALCGCEPGLKINVKLMDGYSRENLNLSLSIYAPAKDSKIDCERIRFGEVSLSELRSTRVYHQVLYSADKDVGDIPQVSVEQGDNIAIALGSYQGASDVELGQADLAGCYAFEQIERLVEVTMTVEPTARVVIPDQQELFLSARFTGTDSAAGLQVEQRLPSGDIVSLADGIPLEFFDYRGQEIASDVRVQVRYPDGSGPQQQLGTKHRINATAQLTQTGTFQIAIAASYQRHSGTQKAPLLGLAYRAYVDSVEVLSEQQLVGIERMTPVAIGVLANGQSMPAAVATVKKTGPDSYWALLSPVTKESLSMPVLLAETTGHVPTFLGAIEVEQQRIGLALSANHQLAIAPGYMQEQLPTDTVVVGPMLQVQGCAQEANYLVGLRHLSDLPLNHIPLRGFWLADTSQSSVSLQKNEDNPLFTPPTTALRTSFCLDDDSGSAHRVLGYHVSGLRALLILASLGSSGANSIGDFDQAKGLRGIFELADNSNFVHHSVNGKRQLLVAVAHNGALEVNGYELVGSADDVELRHSQTLMSVPLRGEVLSVHMALGHFTRPPQSSNDPWELAVVVLYRGWELGDMARGQLILIAMDGTPLGSLPLWLLPSPCNNMRNAFCKALFSTRLVAVDFDQDGQDELLVTSVEDTLPEDPPQPKPRIRVIGF